MTEAAAEATVLPDYVEVSVIWAFSPGSKIIRVRSQLCPPSAVLENKTGPRVAFACSTSEALSREFGKTNLSQTA